MSKHKGTTTEFDTTLDIPVEYIDDKKNKGSVPVRRVVGAAAVLTTGIALGAATHGVEGNHSQDADVSDGHHRIHHGKTTNVPDSITIHVGKGDTADEIADQFTDNYTELKEVSADVVTAEPNAPVLNQGDSLQVSTEHMDPQAVEDYLQDEQNSAGH